MRRIILLLLIFISQYAKGQKKLDNTIVVDTIRNIQEIKRVLFDNGFTIDGSDTTFFVTTAKQMKTASVVRLMIARTDTSIIIKGQYKFQVKFMGIEEEFTPVEFRPSKQNLNHDWFEEMNKVAKLLGSKIRYFKQ